MFKKGDLIRFTRKSRPEPWYDVLFRVDRIHDQTNMYCSPTTIITSPDGRKEGPNDPPSFWSWVENFELAMDEDEVIKEHLSDETKYADEFQAILIGLKHSTK